MSGLQKVKLYGTTGAKFGREFEFVASNAREVIRAMCGTIPGFKRYMQRAHQTGLTFAVFIGDKNIQEHNFDDPTGGQTLRIAPVVQGNKRGGALNTIIGAVIIVIGVIMLYFPVTAGFAPAVIKFGAAMMVGGIVQMLAPQPPGLGTNESPDNRPNYTFDGAKNLRALGADLPVSYGECWAGSVLVSGGIYNEDQA